jgi:OOP family OmpA-OmpF porin
MPAKSRIKTPCIKSEPVPASYNVHMRAISGGTRLAALGFSLVAMAGEVKAEGPIDPAIDVQLFEPAIGPRSFVSVGDAELSAPKQISADFLVTYLTDPFVIYDFDEGAGEPTRARTAVVESVVAAQLSGAYGLTSRIQLGASLPMILRMSGEGVRASDAMAGGGLTASGLGDLVVEAKLGLLQRGNFGLAAAGGITLPTSVGSDGGDYLGDDLPGLRARALAQLQVGPRVRLGANLGLLGRKSREVYGSEVGSQLTYGAAAAGAIGERLSLIAEIFGRTGLISPSVAASPLEAIGAIRLQANSSVSVLVGGGGGLVAAIGSPAVRLFAAASWAPDMRDGDGDGVANSRDRCLSEREDRDGFEDGDGCPDLDQDGDKRLDTEDKCPAVPEDIDGFDDDDGCPEADNDGDSIGDFDDRCPNDKEDGKGQFGKDGCPLGKRDSDGDGVADDVDACVTVTEDDDGFDDGDGCPEDNDRDGVPDASDACRMCPEDKDGKDDGDGCPEVDDDRDGVLDGKDRCPAEPETWNGVKDDDGCPDTGGRLTATFANGKIALTKAPDFSASDKLVRAGDADPIALAMLAHPEVKKWRIVVAAKRQASEDATRERSQAQAEAIANRLAALGVDPDRLEAIGAVSDKPTAAIVALEKVDPEEAGAGDAMCPASLRVTPNATPAGKQE